MRKDLYRIFKKKNFLLVLLYFQTWTNLNQGIYVTMSTLSRITFSTVLRRPYIFFFINNVAILSIR